MHATGRYATLHAPPHLHHSTCSSPRDSRRRGRHWFLETDLKSGLQLKTDKTGRAVLTLLRHAGRLQEVRTTVAGAQNTVYLLQIPSNC